MKMNAGENVLQGDKTSRMNTLKQFSVISSFGSLAPDSSKYHINGL